VSGRTYRIEQLSKVDVEKGVWFYLQRSPGRLPDRDLVNCLKWFLEQMLFEQFAPFVDEEDSAIVGLNVGVDQPFAEHGEERVKAHRERLQTKHLAMQFAGLLAYSRIEGVEPRFEEVPDIVRRALEDDLEDYTQYFFAFELLKNLRLVTERVHGLSIPPIKVDGFEDCWSYLAEATRCWLHGLDSASAALCRASLELALRSAIERRNAGSHAPTGKKGGQIVSLIRAAFDGRILDDPMRQMADEVRITGNEILHGNVADGIDPSDLLVKTRAVVEHIVRNGDGKL
jgi:hypothetical protein